MTATVGNFPDLASAKVAQSLLDAEGIESVIPDEYLAGIDWQMGTALHGVRLQVAEEDADEAAAILAKDEEVLETTAPAAEDLCPSCGSEAIGPPRWKHRLKAATLFAPWLLLLWPLVAMAGSSMKCRSCGHGWSLGRR